jgi:D-alanyl-D-alanine carboxypeptidase
MKIRIILLLALSFQLSVNAQSVALLDSFMNHLSTHKQYMGALSVKSGNKDPLSWYSGFSNLEAGRPINKESTFRIGSISKMFTAVMILQLLDEEKLSLSNSLHLYFPEFPKAKEITIEHLLRHRSGIHNFTNDPEYLEYMTIAQTRDEMLAHITAKPFDFEPGEKAEYSNSNYVLLGYIIEQLTSSTYAQQLEARITKPLKLTQTSAGFPGPAGINEVLSYEYSGTRWDKATNTDLSIPHGAGMVISTAKDLNNFIRGLFQGRLIKAETLVKMTTLVEGFGMGIFPIPFGNRMAFGHNGGIDGFSSTLGYFTDDSTSFALCLNGSRFPMNDMAIGALSSYYNAPYEFPDFELSAKRFSAEEMVLYEGIYSSLEIPLKIEIKGLDGVLMAQATGQNAFPLTPNGVLDFRFDPAEIKMKFNPSTEGKKMLGFTLNQTGSLFNFSREE